MHHLRTFYEKLLFGGMALAAGLILAMAVLVAADVVLRNVGWANLPWVMEVSEYILFIATFAAAPWALHAGVHVHVDVVTRLLPTRWAGMAEVVAGVIGLGVSLFLVVFGTLAAWDAFRLDALIFKQLVVPEWWLLAVTPLAGLLLVVESALHISGFRSPRDERGREPLARDGF